jgi:transcriptional regulator with XRE-family HTH domain
MIDRIKQVMDYSGLSPAQFATELGINRSNLTHLFTGRNQPSLDFIRKILIRFPQVKTEWLMMGMGPMLKDESVKSQIPIVIETNEPDLFSQMENKVEKKVPVKENSPLEKTEINESNLLEESIKTKKNVIENSVRELNPVREHPSGPQIFNSREGKKVKRIVMLYTDNTFEIYDSQ